MTVLPIVARELRVVARKAAVYWGRAAFAAATILVAAMVFVFSAGLPQAQMGRQIFEWLAGIMLFYCLIYGRGATADCLSQEKRDGTLGLLFLTDLKGYDVVLGKLAATSVRGFYALLAVIPVLAVPLLLGGVASGEFWRVVLVLTVTFLFSLAIGILGSALSRDQRKAMAANLNLLLLFMALPPACMAALGYFLPKVPPVPELLFSCPVYSLYLCDQLAYQREPEHYWASIGVIHGLTWLLLLAAGWIVPRTWQDRPERARPNRWRELWRAWKYGPVSGHAPFRKRALDKSAFYWLTARARFKPLHVWAVLGCIGLWWLGGRIIAGTLWLEPIMCVVTAVMLNFTLKVWLAIEAGQQLAEDRRTGAFELLLSVPLRVRDIVHGQLLALRRQFLLPALAVFGAEVLLMMAAQHRDRYHETQMIWLAGMLMLAADLVALSWVGMWRALIARNHNLATIGTALRILVLPWLLYGLVMGFGTIWYEVTKASEWSPGWQFCLGLWTALGLGADLVFGGLAWWQLRTRFRELALRPFNPVPSRLARWFGRSQRPSGEARKQTGADRTRRAPEPKDGEKRGETTSAGISAPVASPRVGPLGSGPRTRWVIACCLGLLLAVFGLIYERSRPKVPPAIVVALSQSNGPVRIFPSGHGVLLILPDGSLWHWGQVGLGAAFQAAAPERIGTNVDWVQAAGSYNYLLALRRDGTLWEWGSHSRGMSQLLDLHEPPRQVGSAHDWVSMVASYDHSVALRRDGTVWAWADNNGGQTGAGGPPDPTSLEQIGTNNDWTAICSAWGATLGLRRNGTLWVWGSISILGAAMVAPSNLAWPVQVCLETNWTGFTSGSYSRWVRNRAGELWEPFYAAPNPEAPAAACMRLVVTGASTNSFATAWAGEPKLYELRPNGTIRQRRQPMAWFNTIGAGEWQPFGKRSDWTALWSESSAAFGLTADGTLWTWGFDLSRPPVPTVLSRIKLAYTRLTTFVGTRPRPASGMSYAPTHLKEPRPLLRLVSTNTLPSLRPPAAGKRQPSGRVN